MIKPEDISEVVSTITGIPLNRLSGEEGKRLLGMEKEISLRLF